MQTTRGTLLERLRRGDASEDWDAFDACYQELVLRTCRALGLQHADAEDVYQIVLCSLRGALKSFEYDPRRGRFRDYLGRIVVHEAYRQRAHARTPGLQDPEQVPDLSPTELDAGVDGEWDWQWRQHHLRQALRVLRKTMESRSLEVFEALLRGEEVRGICSATGLKEDAVYKIKQRVRDRLRDRIAEQIAQEEKLLGPRG